MAYRKAKPQGTLLKEFRDHVCKGIKPTELIDSVLLPMAAVYEELSDAAYTSIERAEDINESLHWLNRLEFNDWIPPALAFAVRWRGKPKAMETFFRAMERLAYSMLITKRSINDRIERFSQLTKEIEQADSFETVLPAIQLSPAEQYQTYETLNGRLYENLAARARTAVLLRLDALLSGGGARYDYETITVEHVLPQNPAPRSEWLEWFPDAAERAAMVHSIGNLALLTRKKNSSAGNFDFEKKKTSYFTRGGVSPFVLTTQVLGKTRWTAEVIKQRQQELMGTLEKHWRLQDRKDPLDFLRKNIVHSAAPSLDQLQC
jgi:uncharacterized protein DUF1524